MAKTGDGTFQIKSWDENTYYEQEGESKLSRAEITQLYCGALEGEASLQYLMVSGSDSSAIFTGVERFQGKLEGKSGSLIMLHTGKFESATASSSWSIVKGSGTGELAGVAGSGTFTAKHGGTAEYTVEYALD